jgi:hypothetical protein
MLYVCVRGRDVEQLIVDSRLNERAKNMLWPGSILDLRIFFM